VPGKRPTPLTATQLREINQRCGKQPVVRLLLWEISRLRGVIKLFYRQIVRLTLNSEERTLLLDGAVEEAMEDEPAILEEQRQDSRPSVASVPRTPRPHMSEQAEERLRRAGRQSKAIVTLSGSLAKQDKIT